MCHAMLLQRIYGSASLKELDMILRKLFEGLRAEVTNLEAGENSCVRIDVKGEDAEVAVHLLERVCRLAPIEIEAVEQHSVLTGYVVSEIRENAISVDVGLIQPRIVCPTIPLERLRGQLADGSKLTLEHLVNLFGFVKHLPIEIRVTRIQGQDLDAELTEGQLALYSYWINDMIDRLIVLGASRKRVEEAVKRSRFTRDIVGIESLGLFEQVVVCKLGTDARGLIGDLGNSVHRAKLVAFSPRKILATTADHWSTETSRSGHSKYKQRYVIQAQVWKGK